MEGDRNGDRDWVRELLCIRLFTCFGWHCVHIKKHIHTARQSGVPRSCKKGILETTVGAFLRYWNCHKLLQLMFIEQCGVVDGKDRRDG